MKYNPDLHNRRSVRLRGHDYANMGAYFVTICCQDRINYFGEIVNNEMAFNEYGDLAYKEWKKLSERYPEISFDIFQIMPNHIHGIIQIQNPNVGATLACLLRNGFFLIFFFFVFWFFPYLASIGSCQSRINP